jgi:lysophospholipase L1-like esterase
MAGMTEDRGTQKKPAGFWRILLTSIGVFLLFCLVAEGVLRLAGYGNTDLYVPDQRLLWVPKPGTRTTVVGHHPSTISPDHFRYPVALGPKRPGEFRIFAFGDSVTMGWGVNDNETYVADLATTFNGYHCPAVKFEGISAGVDAYSNAQVNDSVQVVFEKGFQPDLVIVANSFNTEFENLNRLEGKNREALLRRVWLKSYVRRSALYEFVIEHLLRGMVYYKMRHQLMNGSWNVYRRKPVDTQRFYQELGNSLATCRAHHVPMILLLTPSTNQRGDLDPMQQTMVDFANAENVPIANVIVAWKKKDHTPLFMDHAHPTIEGNQLIAQQLATLIDAAGAIPCGPDGKPLTPAIAAITAPAAPLVPQPAQ